MNRTQKLLSSTLLLGALSASACSGFAEQLCARQEAIVEGVHEAADYLGPIGHVADQIVAFFLDVLCVGVISVPAEITDAGAMALGIIPSPAPVPDPVPVPQR